MLLNRRSNDQLWEPKKHHSLPILDEGPSGRKRRPLTWISRLPSIFFPSACGRGKTFLRTYGWRPVYQLVQNKGSPPFISISLSCSTTSANSFFSFSRLVAAFFIPVICSYTLSICRSSVDRKEACRTKVASTSANGYRQLASAAEQGGAAYHILFFACDLTRSLEVDS